MNLDFDQYGKETINPTYIVQETLSGTRTIPDEAGLTKREYFAAVALQGLLSGECAELYERNYYEATKAAVKFADHLLIDLMKE